MVFIEKEELLEAIERKYGDLDDEGGCYVSTDRGYAWLSVKDIVDIINDCLEYDD